MKPIYLDNNASTPVDPKVLETMLPWIAEHPGNPGAPHTAGRRAEKAIRTAKAQIAALIGAAAEEILPTSGGSEALSTAILGACQAQPEKRHVVTSRAEHPATLRACQYLETQGYRITRMDVDAGGGLDLDELEAALTPDTALATFLWANNETGVIFPVRGIAERTRKAGILLHLDAVQAAGKVEIHLGEIPAELISISAHKFHGPKGSGALFTRKTCQIPALIHGNQEGGRRGGTPNVPGIVGMGAAAELAGSHLSDGQDQLQFLRDLLEGKILTQWSSAGINGASPRLPNTANLYLPGVEGAAGVLQLDARGVQCSAGSACTSGKTTPSHVLEAMGMSRDRATQSLRFSLGYQNTEEEINLAAEIIIKTLKP